MSDLNLYTAPIIIRPGEPTPKVNPRRHPMAAVAVLAVLLAGLVTGTWLQTGAAQSRSTAGPSTLGTSGEPGSKSSQLSAFPDIPLLPTESGRAASKGRSSTKSSTTSSAAVAAPRVVGQLVSPAQIRTKGCQGDRATALTKVSTTGDPRSVVLVWRSPDGKVAGASMTRLGPGWVAPLGPFPTAGPVQWQITVTDARGMKAQGPIGTLSVVPC